MLFHHCKMSRAPIPGFFLMAAKTAVGSATFGQVVRLRTECHMFASQTCHSMARRGEQKSERLSPIPGILTCGDTCSVSAAFYNEPSARTGFTPQESPSNLCASTAKESEILLFISSRRNRNNTLWQSFQNKEGRILEVLHISLAILMLLHSRICQWVPADVQNIFD